MRWDCLWLAIGAVPVVGLLDASLSVQQVSIHDNTRTPDEDEDDDVACVSVDGKAKRHTQRTG